MPIRNFGPNQLSAPSQQKANRAAQRANQRWRADPQQEAQKARASLIATRTEYELMNSAQFRAENRELLAERQRQWYAKNWIMRALNSEYRAKIATTYEQARQRRENDPEWAAHLDAYRKEYYKKNKHKFIASERTARRADTSCNAALADKGAAAGNGACLQRRRRTDGLTGVRHEVDHVWPIKGRKSCGLHVPWNLQVITWKENSRKRAREPAE